MNAEQLEALIIDQSLGELPDDVSALLDAYLGQHPDQAAIVSGTRSALAATEAAVAERPGLFRVSHDDPGAREFAVDSPVIMSLFASALGKGAAAVVALALATGAGFFLGRLETDSSTGAIADREREAVESTQTETSPWARYQVRENGQLAVVPSFPRSPDLP